MADSRLQALKGKLESAEEVVESLETLNTLLVADSSLCQVSHVLSSIPLSLLFSCLQTQDPDQVKLACAVLEKVLGHLTASQVVEHAQYLELGLQYPHPKVAKTCLQLLLRLCADTAVGEMVLAPTMLHLIMQLVGGADLQCASFAADILLHFSTQYQILESKLKRVWFSELDTLLRGSDTVRYRVFDLMVKTCVQGGKNCFATVSSAGYLDQLVQELELSDPLVVMNCIELLGCLIESPEGLGYLMSGPVLDRLYQTLTNSKQDVMAAILVPGILKFFGQLCIGLGVEAVVLFGKYPNFLRLTLEAALSPSDDTVWGIAVDTFGLLASSLSGRRLLLSAQDATERVLSKLGELIALSPSPIRCRSLRAVKMMVSCKEECSWELSISKQWFAKIHKQHFQQLMSIVQQPFTDLRLAGQMVLVELAAHEWGQREMQAGAGFLEYLVDRNSEPDKEGRELKYEIVHIIVESEHAERVWGNVDMLKMRKYEREGPHHFSGNTTVAIEGAS